VRDCRRKKSRDAPNGALTAGGGFLLPATMTDTVIRPGLMERLLSKEVRSMEEKKIAIKAFEVAQQVNEAIKPLGLEVIRFEALVNGQMVFEVACPEFAPQAEADLASLDTLEERSPLVEKIAKDFLEAAKLMGHCHFKS
jgi:hypothetical protein